MNVPEVEINRNILISVFVLGFVIGGFITTFIAAFKEDRKRRQYLNRKD